MAVDFFYVKSSFEDLIFDEICKKFENRVDSIETGSPVNASTYEWYVPFLDGGLVRYTGNYFVGPRGTYIIGYKALRYVCAIAAVRPPQRFLKGEVDAFTVQSLQSEVNVKLGEEVRLLEQKQKDLMDLWLKRFSS